MLDQKLANDGRFSPLWIRHKFSDRTIEFKRIDSVDPEITFLTLYIFLVVYRYLWRHQFATYIYLHVLLLECLWKDVCFTTPCLFEDMKCQGVNAKLYGKLCRCIPRDSKRACGDAVLQLWIREVVWALTGVLRILTHLLSFSVLFSFSSPLPSPSSIP